MHLGQPTTRYPATSLERRQVGYLKHFLNSNSYQNEIESGKVTLVTQSMKTQEIRTHNYAQCNALQQHN